MFVRMVGRTGSAARYGSASVKERPETILRGYRRFRCRTSGRELKERSAGVLDRTCLPSDVIAFGILPPRLQGDAPRPERDPNATHVKVSHGAVRDWEAKPLPVLRAALRRLCRGTRLGAGVSCRPQLRDARGPAQKRWPQPHLQHSQITQNKSRSWPFA